MQKTLLVIRQELASTFSRRSYLLFAFGIPALAIMIVAGLKFIQNRTGSRAATASGGSSSSSQSVFDLQAEGFVDQSGVIQSLPKNVPPNRIIAYPDEAKAKQALNSGEITAYYVIPPDYLASGKIYYIYPDTKSYLSDGQSWIIHWILTVNLLGQDLKKADRLWNPIRDVKENDLSAPDPVASTTIEDCSRPGTACETNDLIRYMPGIMVAFLFITLMMSSSLLFNSLGTEKDNRTLEVLLLSVHPRQLLAGKIIALGLAGLIQTFAWLAAIFISVKLGGSALSLPADFTFPVDILIFSLLFFLGGYGLYAALLSGVGALIPNMKETGGVLYLALIPLMIGYMIGLFAPLLGVANASLLVFLSIFPFTAPVVMVMRLTDGIVPLWQTLLAISLLYLTAYLALRAAATMFRAQSLLSGQPFSLGRYFKTLSRKAV